jgi:hypothetical protein
MKKYICLFLFTGFSIFCFAQKSTAHFCNYKGGDTEVKGGGRGDTNQIFYKGQPVGYIVCDKIKIKGGAMFQNVILDNNMKKVADVGSETAQLYIKYTNPYKMEYVRGFKFDYVIKQMVDVDKRLIPAQ